MNLETRATMTYERVSQKTIDPMTAALIVQIILAIMGQCLAKRSKSDIYHFIKKRPIIAKVIIRRNIKDYADDKDGAIEKTIEALADDVTMEGLEQVEKDLEYVNP